MERLISYRPLGGVPGIDRSLSFQSIASGQAKGSAVHTLWVCLQLLQRSFCGGCNSDTLKFHSKTSVEM